MSLIGAVLALIFLDPPLKWVVAGCLLATDVVEVWLWLRWRRRRSTTGPEGLIGTVGVVVRDLDPRGQIKAKGQIWTARSSRALSAGTRVEIVAVDGLEVSVVELSAAGERAQSTSVT
jgi:membrane-bound serine protease (ClpP class)